MVIHQLNSSVIRPQLTTDNQGPNSIQHRRRLKQIGKPQIIMAQRRRNQGAQQEGRHHLRFQQLQSPPNISQKQLKKWSGEFKKRMFG